jgi:glycosyltransferase involved in cell wall biosynthesis
VTRRWIKRQIVKQFDAAFVGGEPHKRHFASLGIPADKIFTGYDAVDNDFFASRADDVREKAKKSVQCSVSSVQQEERADEVRSMPSGSENLRVGEEQGARSVEQERPEASVLRKDGFSVFQNFGFSDFRKTYGLPQRYFLSLGRMVEKKNLATLVAAYARFARASVERSKSETGNLKLEAGGQRPEASGTENRTLNTAHCVPALVFVGSGELENALREQARGLGLRVIDRSDWKAGQSSHRLTRIDADGAERLAADRTEGNADGRMTSAADGLSAETTDGRDAAATTAENCKPNTENSVESDRGAVYFYGFRQIEENPVFYALAEAFALPSLKEEWGLVVNEAMACSLPVIVSRTAGCAEDLVPGSESWRCSVGSVQSGEDAGSLNPQRSTLNSLEERSNGFVFDPSSVDALSDALRRIADQETKRPKDEETNGLTEMGKRSREIVAKFSCENFARQALSAARAAQKA